jgi:integrase/recombinase XerD
MTPLRQRFINELTRRAYSPRTLKTYVECVSLFARHFNASPDALGPDQVRTYQLHLLDRGLSRSRLKQAACALRFFYRFVLLRPWAQSLAETFIPFPRAQVKRPVLLTKDELRSFLDAIPSLKYRAALMAAYAGGLRLSEVLHLRVQDIDSKNMRLFVHQGKGRVDRVVMLSNNLLVVLRAYWTVFRPSNLLFPGRAPEIPFSPPDPPTGLPSRRAQGRARPAGHSPLPPPRLRHTPLGKRHVSVRHPKPLGASVHFNHRALRPSFP